MSTTSARAKPASKAKASQRLVILVATRKGAWLFHGDARRRSWKVDGPHFLGHTISHLQMDPRDGRTLLAAAKTGHLGPTIFRSTDLGRSWKEAQQPPAFAKPSGELPARSVDHTFWLSPGHASETGSWYAGTSPQGLFRSEDGGVSWAPLPGVNDNPQLLEWMGSVQDGTPDGPKLHSIIIDPRDPAHLYFGMSGGGVHESRDGGRSWATLIKGMQVVGGFDPDTVTFHDPHCLRLCPSNPDRLYQQNHCGIYRLDRTGDPADDVWQRIGLKMPKRVGDIGFPMVVHPFDADTAWVFPMDGTDVWPRTSPDGRPAAYVTRNAGKSWQRLDQGLPSGQAWWTLKRQAMTVDTQAVPALYLGTTSGELWIGHEEGANWVNIARHLPEIYAVEVATLP
ncbi:glycosyl hydrolase [Paucibacter sp. TC2R-5]|uniref:WD40/YVTN/BNR-like repeat-containing protein n=1 Tax=Paucibacter sp. TC2R-5 TaxID=2893555 RepID=UPI0021E40F64|nr:glycosyl hydrolase [Paucibacter sp. TC2R-5]MCV2361353.1 glycosyl hydrolase [Paucibacter sp. TC2R-5]